MRAKRRVFSAAEELRILREAERSPKGALGALLRRGGVYSGHMTKWRRQRERGDLAALAPRKRGPQVDEQAQRQAQLEHERARLAAKLAKAELIIAAQKKSLQLPGLPEPDLPETSETP